MEQTLNAALKPYLGAIRKYEREFDQWQRAADRATKIYRDEGEKKSRFSIFWSNVQTLQPALYARTPNPQCERRFKDRNPVGRTAAEILERIASFQVKDQDFDTTMRAARDDYLIPSRGVVWVRYKAEFSQEQLGVDEAGQPVYAKASEKAALDYVFWKDFGHDVVRRWDDVKKVWRKTYMTRPEVEKRFPGKAEFLKFESTPDPEKNKGDKEEEDQRACIYEVWCKDSKQVYWLCPEYTEEFLDVKPDIYNLRGFFPCPRPIFGSLTNDSLVPLIDYARYEALASELDELVGRRRALLKAVKVVGAFDSSQPELQSIFESGLDLALIPSNNWPQLQQAGGLKGAVDLIDISPYVKALAEINAGIAEVKNEIYELTGISDIIRGYSNPNATATAESIKGNFATLRLEDRQKEIQRFARDAIALMAELAVEKFDPETIAEMAGVKDMGMEAQQLFPQCLALLKDDKLRTYQLSIETDSTIAVDEQEEKQRRTEALTAFGQFIERAVPQIMNMPELAPVLSEMLLFGARTFPSGRQLEFALEQSLEMLQAKVKQQQQQPPPPDPEMLKVEQQAKAKEAELNLKAQESQVDAQLSERKMQVEMQLAHQKMQADIELEKLKINNELALKQFEIMQRLQFEAAQPREEALAAPVAAAPSAEMPPMNLNINVTPGNKKIVFGTDQNGQRVADVIETGALGG